MSFIQGFETKIMTRLCNVNVCLHEILALKRQNEMKKIGEDTDNGY
jgi:hypothetical protein